MRLDLLPFLACPECGGDLSFSLLAHMPRPGEDVAQGRIACQKCGGEYPIENSVPILLGSLDAPARRTGESFGWEWLRYPGALPEDRRVFLEETQIPEEAWRGRFVLDGGCGMGRYAMVALSLGAEVVAFDLSGSIDRLVFEARRNPRLHLVRGDLLRPPFKRARFDIAYSIGVIHHTPNAELALGRLAGLVKPGGLLSVWVYGRPGSLSSFSSNPLKAGRAWLGKWIAWAWALVWIRMLLSDGLRLVTTRLPVPLLYGLCHPLAALGAVPLVKFLTFSVHPDYRVRLQENFDWLAPPYQSKHTKEELRRWFEANGFSVFAQLAHGLVPKPGFAGVKRRP
jgi:SAM-dependent methyltransferase